MKLVFIFRYGNRDDATIIQTKNTDTIDITLADNDKIYFTVNEKRVLVIDTTKWAEVYLLNYSSTKPIIAGQKLVVSLKEMFSNIV
jgi:hypothetical protein